MGDAFGEAEADATVELVYDPGGVRIREMPPRRQQTPPRNNYVFGSVKWHS